MIPEILALLKDKREHSNVRLQVAKSLIAMGKQEEVFPYLALLRRDAARRDYVDITGDFMYNYAALATFAPLLNVVYPRSNIFIMMRYGKLHNGKKCVFLCLDFGVSSW